MHKTLPLFEPLTAVRRLSNWNLNSCWRYFVFPIGLTHPYMKVGGSGELKKEEEVILSN